VSPPSSTFTSTAGSSTAGGLAKPKDAAKEAPKDTAKEGAQTMSLADLKYSEGIEQAAQNRLDEAEVTLREAVRLDASKPEYLTALARVLLGNPRYERAGTLPVVRSLLDRAVQLAPDNVEATELHAQVIKEMAG
jgi:Flp pilus assembly protein TadD